MLDGTIQAPFKYALYALFAMAWCSGMSFFVLKTWFVLDGEFGPMRHPWQFSVLQIHAAAAFAMMLGFGFLLGAHVQYTWKLQRARIPGMVLVTLLSMLMISAYLLYYIVHDDFREILEYLHLALGFFLPVALIAHVWKRKSKHEKREINEC
ncbi:hypothetical protein A9Q89_07520 [Gammaproteobacteria bacterium 53_120_T64]|nr:hypothetical protein A9Q89_07520 [Gammaproteobacteria bacterium 53_120_T64]